MDIDCCACNASHKCTAQLGALIVQERVIVGIDVGTTKVCVLVGQVLTTNHDRDGKLNIVGVGTCPSQGLRHGVPH